MRYVDFGTADDPIVIPQPESYRDCLELIRSDYFRYSGVHASMWRLLWAAIRKELTFGYVFWMRLASHRKGIGYPVFRVIHYFAGVRTGVHIPPPPSGNRIGYGLYVAHGVGMVVNPSTVIGNNVSLYHFLSIGSNQGRAAVIGNEVFIGPHVCLVENVHIGSHSVIGAGAVVVHDIPQNCTAAGVPAKVVKKSAKNLQVYRYPVPEIPDEKIEKEFC